MHKNNFFKELLAKKKQGSAYIQQKPNEIRKTTKKQPEKLRISSKDLTRSLVLKSYGLPDEYYASFETHNIPGTLYPINTPLYLCGQKGSGKTYLLASIMQKALKDKIIKRVFYLYANNIDNTIARAIDRRAMFSIPIGIAAEFLFKFLRKKTKFTTAYNYLTSITYAKKQGENIDPNGNPAEQETYWDNQLDLLTKAKKLKTVKELLDYCGRVVDKYGAEGTKIEINGLFSYNLGPLSIEDFDAIIIDDIGQFYTLFGNNRASSSLYKFFTITRQNKTNFYMTGQEIIQLPRMFREMLGAVVLLGGTDLNDLKELRLPKTVSRRIVEEWPKLKKYGGFLYNYNENELEEI